MTPVAIILGEKRSQSVISWAEREGRRSDTGFDGTGIVVVAKFATRKNSRAFAGMCRLKSTRLCTKNPQQAMMAAHCKETTKDDGAARTRRLNSKTMVARKNAQQRPPRTPVSARASR